MERSIDLPFGGALAYADDGSGPSVVLVRTCKPAGEHELKGGTHRWPLYEAIAG